MRPWRSLRAHTKWHHPCHERVEEGNVEDFQEEVDRDGLSPGELFLSRLIRHYRDYSLEVRVKMGNERMKN